MSTQWSHARLASRRHGGLRAGSAGRSDHRSRHCAADPSQSYALFVPGRVHAIAAPGQSSSRSIPAAADGSPSNGIRPLQNATVSSSSGPTTPAMEGLEFPKIARGDDQRRGGAPGRGPQARVPGRHVGRSADGTGRGAGVERDRRRHRVERRISRHQLRKTLSFPLFATAGTEDFNHLEMRRLDRELTSPHRLVIFDGGHVWLSSELALQAVEWMELHAMKAGLKPRNDAEIDRLLARRALSQRPVPAATRRRFVRQCDRRRFSGTERRVSARPARSRTRAGQSHSRGARRGTGRGSPGGNRASRDVASSRPASPRPIGSAVLTSFARGGWRCQARQGIRSIRWSGRLARRVLAL